ncbi:hypothetical protein [Microcoleus vaginatus]|uniref:hypothetical protein n=1 Tax=Microcoleus vaginatus TaxID=119532 RepID=UPI0016838ADE|nr:hypothetical protein [Microcoleus sp. FACHB-84]MBD2010304.1 hypothetical protein [Microcoleus sp. FACHB-45]
MTALCFRGKKEEGSSATDSLDGCNGCNGCQEEGRGKREEGRGKKQEGRGKIIPSSFLKFKIQT